MCSEASQGWVEAEASFECTHTCCLTEQWCPKEQALTIIPGELNGVAAKGGWERMRVEDGEIGGRDGSDPEGE